MTTPDLVERLRGLCKIESCKRQRYLRGWCQPHYGRWRRHGDPLKGGKDIGEVQAYFKETVLSHEGEQCLIWPYSRTTQGYAVMVYDGRQQAVSRVVCQLVNGEPDHPSLQAAHSCGRGHEGCVSRHHLSWKTPADNQADRIVHGTVSTGEKNHQSKLTEADVLAIRSLAGAITLREIAAQFQISQSQVSNIIRRINWAHVKDAA